LKRIKTSKIGIYYNLLLNGDKVYYITYKDIINSKKVWIKIGKYSEGIRENYCVQKRNEILTKQRLGEEPPLIVNKKKKTFLKFETLQEKYFETRKVGKSKQSDISSAKKHILPFFNSKDIEILTRDDIKIFKQHLKEKTNLHGDPLSNKTVNNILTLFSAILHFGLKEELIKNDSTKYIEKDKVDNERERYLSIEEINQLYETVKEDEQLYLFCKLALTTGGRLATILNISKKDLDFTNQIITLKDFKNNSTYKSFLTDELVNLLKTWSSNLHISDKIFHYKPTMIQRETLAILHKLFNKGIDKTDRKNLVVLHTLRHTFASHLAINGTPIFTIQKLMNHKDIKMTLRYAKLAPESGKQSVKDLYNI